MLVAVTDDNERIYAVDCPNRVVYALHFDSMYREIGETEIVRFQDWENESGDPSDYEDYIDTVGGYRKYLPSTKRITHKLIKHFQIYSFQNIKSDRYIDYDRLVASPFLRKFWE